MPATRCAVAIVGAGPAGATCANALMKAGGDGVALIDKATFPRDKACGDGLGPGVIPILEELGLDDILKAHKRVTHMSMSSPFGNEMELDTSLYDRRSPLGYVITRREFDHALAAAALSRGAMDLTGWDLEAAEFRDDAWHLKLKHTGTDERRDVRADVLIGADGATSKVRRILGEPFNVDRHTSIAVRIYAKSDNHIAPHQQLDVVDRLPTPGYGWLFSDGDGLLNIGVGTEVETYKSQSRHLKEMLGIYRAHLGPSFEFDEPSNNASVLPMASQLPRLSFPEKRAALIGDAASMINPLTGEGIFYGMFAGMELGKNLANPKRHPDNVPGVLADYETDFRKTFVPHFRGNYLLRKMLERPRLLDMMVKACARNHNLSYDYIEYFMGNEGSLSRKPLYNIALRTLLS